MPELDAAALLAAYDTQLRGHPPDPMPVGWRIEWDGPVYRCHMARAGFVGYRSVADLAPAELDALIARQRDIFAGLGQQVEWKWHAHDRPADLPGRLRAAGFEPEERETVVVGLAEPLTTEMPPLPDGVRIRPVTARADLDRIAAMESEVWSQDRAWLADELHREVAAARGGAPTVGPGASDTSAGPAALDILVAEAGDTVVSAGWIRYEEGTEFAGLWGGSTLAQWRRKGIYRALVAARARLAVDRGFTYLQVDASDDSRPILERLGFVPLTETRPYVFTPEVRRVTGR